MDIQKLTGEQLAQTLNGEWNKLVAAQSNIQIINQELERRTKETPKTE